jgi:8-oxo-dGTP diphosphatase
MPKSELDLSEGEGIRTGVDVLTVNSNHEVLLGLHIRNRSQVWGFPGGHIRTNETMLEAAHRELNEELGARHGIQILPEIVAVRENCIAPWFVHHLTVILLGKFTSGEILRAEPEKLLEWKWFALDQLPNNLFSGVEEILHNFSKHRVWVVNDWLDSKENKPPVLTE